MAVTLAGAWGMSAERALSWPALSWPSALSVQAAFLAFFLGTPLVAALPFGEEFHHRTMVLLLSGPVSRARIWLDKWLAVVSVLAVLAGVQFVVFYMHRPADVPPAVAIMFVVMVVCSAPLWTLVARTTIGGLVFTVSVIMMQELAMGLFVSRVLGITTRQDVFVDLPGLHAIRAAYALVTLGLGWRAFARFQVTGAGFGVGTGIADGWAILRPRRGRLLGNIVRKELMLQRPAFMTAAGFVACWLVSLGVVSMQTRPERLAEVLFPLLIAIFMPLVIALAGTISVGEETSLGIRAWHLTLPVSARVQWGSKLVVSMTIGLLLGFVLPAAMSALAGAVVPHGPGRPAFFETRFILLVAGAVVLAFWASTLLGDTVKAAVATGVAILGVGLCGAIATRLIGAVPFRAPFLRQIVVRYQLPPNYFQTETVLMLIIGCGIGLGLLLAAWQSLAAFRQAQIGTRTAGRYAATLFVASLGLAIGTNSVIEGVGAANHASIEELRAAMQALPMTDLDAAAANGRAVTLDELDRAHALSANARQWLENTTIIIERFNSYSGERYKATLQFPQNRKYAFTFARGGPQEKRP